MLRGGGGRYPGRGFLFPPLAAGATVRCALQPLPVTLPFCPPCMPARGGEEKRCRAVPSTAAPPVSLPSCFPPRRGWLKRFCCPFPGPGWANSRDSPGEPEASSPPPFSDEPQNGDCGGWWWWFELCPSNFVPGLEGHWGWGWLFPTAEEGGGSQVAPEPRMSICRSSLAPMPSQCFLSPAFCLGSHFASQATGPRTHPPYKDKQLDLACARHAWQGKNSQAPRSCPRGAPSRARLLHRTECK